MENYKVAIAKADIFTYPDKPPFRPSEHFPEYPFLEFSPEPNNVYSLVRSSFHLLGLDNENYGTKNWNPLGRYVHIGDYVVIKPNLVLDTNRNGGNLDCMITHPSVVAAVLDYVVIALGGKGTIVVGDAPVQECNFNNLIKITGYADLIDYYRKVLPKSINITLKDFRGISSVSDHGIKKYKVTAEKGIVVDLGEHSLFYGKPESNLSNLRITNYDPNILKSHHNLQKHEYSICADILKADVIINMPKPKTHRKAGVTISLKNMIGANTRKEFLPHHTNGSIKEDGDCYEKKSYLKSKMNKYLDKVNYYSQAANQPRLAKFYRYIYCCFAVLSKLFGRKNRYFEGSWYGNNTISKTTIDVNRIISHSDKSGKLILDSSAQRRMFIVADMIVSGEKEGPLLPSPKEVGIIAAGENQVAFDSVISKLIGIRQDKYGTIIEAIKCDDDLPLYSKSKFPVETISNFPPYSKSDYSQIDDRNLLYFQPSFGWIKAFLNK